MKINILKYILAILLFSFSCKEKKENETVIKEKREVNSKKIQLFYKNISSDTVEVRVEYISPLDTISTSNKNERFSFLYWTKEDISTNEMEKIIENDDKQRMKEENVKGYNLGDKRSMVFNYNFIPEEKNYLTLLVEDLVFINDSDKDSTRIIQKISTLKERVFVP